MEKTLSQSLKLVNSNILYVLLAGILSAQTLFIGISDVFWIAFVLSICVEVIIFSKFISKINNTPNEGPKAALKYNLFNFLIVTIVLSGLIILVAILVNTIPLDTQYLININIGIKALVVLVTAYVFPIVLIKRANLIAIPTGIVFFTNNIRNSYVIIILAVSLFLIEFIAIFLIFNSLIDMSLLLYFSVVVNILTTYVLFLIFVAASILLLNEPNKSLNQKGAENAPSG
jgi:hypothetical protein